jgi:hypothetical protein
MEKRARQQEELIRKEVDQNPFEVFARLCTKTGKTDFIQKEAALNYLNKYHELIKNGVLAFLGGSAITGGLAYSIFPKNSLYTSLFVGTFALIGGSIGISSVKDKLASQKFELYQIMQAYGEWSSNPKVIKALTEK